MTIDAGTNAINFAGSGSKTRSSRLIFSRSHLFARTSLKWSQ
jgi:hypothetical protein